MGATARSDVAAINGALLMLGTKQFLHGPVGEVLTEAHLHTLYNIDMRRVRFEHSGQQVETLVPVFDAKNR